MFLLLFQIYTNLINLNIIPSVNGLKPILFTEKNKEDKAILNEAREIVLLYYRCLIRYSLAAICHLRYPSQNTYAKNLTTATYF